MTFLDGLEKAYPAVYADLDTAAFTAVEVIAKWWAIDREGATEAARDLARGIYTVRALSEALDKARKEHAGPPPAGPTPVEEYRKIAMMERGIAKMLGGTLLGWQPEPAGTRRVTVDYRYLLRDVGGGLRKLGVLLVGPYTAENAYRRRRQEWIYRAIALNWAYDVVFLVLPVAKPAKDYEKELAAFQSGALVVRQEGPASLSDPSQRISSVHVIHPGDWIAEIDLDEADDAALHGNF